MVIRNDSNHAKIAAEIGWSQEDVRRFIAHIKPKADESGYFLFPHQDLPGANRYKPLRLGNEWIIQTGSIDLECD